MQPTIASFFQKSSTKQASASTNAHSTNGESKTSRSVKKRKLRIISSDEDDSDVEISTSSRTPKKNASVKKSRLECDQKASPSKSSQSKKLNLDKLKGVEANSKVKVTPADPTVYFAGETKRVNRKRPENPKEKALQEFADDNIDQTLMEIYLAETALGTENAKSPKKRKLSPRQAKNTNAKQSDSEQQQQNLETSVLSDEERYERKRASAILYQKYKNRSLVLNHGCKEIPEGKPDCLAGLTFLVSGVLESLLREEANDVIKKYGGKVMTKVGKRLNYLIVGEDAGPKKLAEAEEHNVKVISEDDLFNLIREKSGSKSETSKEIDIKTSPQIKKKTTPSKGKESLRTPSKTPTKTPTKTSSNSPSKTPNKSLRKTPTKTSSSSKNKISPETRNIKVELPSPSPSKPKPSSELSKNYAKQLTKQELDGKEVKTENHTSGDNLAWVDKYKPKSTKDIIGQQGPASNAVKLTKWLLNWYANQSGPKKVHRPNPWAKNDDGSAYKAALLSGPPGIGKTTTATLVCQELGFDTVEFNASDTRSKRLLKEEVSELLSNKSLYGFCHDKAMAVTKKHVLLMDEVDGMAGNEDRGGIQELITLIKDSSVPIICMCNDRNHQKMRSLVNYCFDLRFNRPNIKQIKAGILSICSKENIKLDGTKIEEIIAATNNDIRQSINHIALLSAGLEINVSPTKSVKDGEKTAQKDLKLGPWEVVRKVFSAEEHKSMSFNDKCDLFFHDYSLAPLFVHQNYLSVSPLGAKSELTRKVALTADALSLGDLVDKKIRSQAAWSLLPTQALFSSVMPGEYMSGYFTAQINFPAWLGKNSKISKLHRLAQEIHDHTRSCTSGSRLSIRLDYAQFLLNKIITPLNQKGAEGIEESVAVLKQYHLLREDIDSLIELTSISNKTNPMSNVEGKVKAALTRTYNKEVMPYSYSVNSGIKKKRQEDALDPEYLLEEEAITAAAAETDDENEDNLENDVMIKAKKKTTTATASTSTGKNPTKAAAGKKTKASTKAKK